VTDIEPSPGLTADELLAITAAVERHSEHPLAEAVVAEANQRTVPDFAAHDVTAIVGRGIRATIDGDTLLIGNDALFEEHGIAVSQETTDTANRMRDEGKSTMVIGRVSGERHEILGVIGVADTVRAEARATIQRLHELGIEKTIILTGDNERAARAIARHAGVDDVRSGLMPEEKLAVIDALKREYGSVVMVGDGVNDAPALATATIGIAMGAAGTDVALETADVVLMADNLAKLPYAVELSRRTRRTIRQNLTFALTVIAVLVTGTLFGLTNLPLGVVGHEGSTIVVVANGLRLLGAGRE
jgi:Cd2+/Zn2+-exporting ATPase